MKGVYRICAVNVSDTGAVKQFALWVPFTPLRFAVLPNKNNFIPEILPNEYGEEFRPITPHRK